MVGSGMALRVMCWVESVVDGPVMVVKAVCFGVELGDTRIALHNTFPLITI